MPQLVGVKVEMPQLEFGLKLRALKMKVLVLLLRSGKVFMKVAKISPATNRWCSILLNKLCKGFPGSWNSLCINCSRESCKGCKLLRTSKWYCKRRSQHIKSVILISGVVQTVSWLLLTMQLLMKLTSFEFHLMDFFRSEPHFYIDSIAIGVFHAMRKGMLTSQSAGTIFHSYKVGPVSSVAPWIFTVADSTTDRRIIDSTVLIHFLFQQRALYEHVHIKWNKFSSHIWKRCFNNKLLSNAS